MKKNVLIIILLIGIISCGHKEIKIINKTKHPIKFVISKNDSIYRDLIINIKGEKNKNIAFIMGGMGTWRDKDLKNFSREIKEIKIFKFNDTIIYNKQEEIYNFFKTKNKGLFKNIIKISIK